MYQRRPQPHHLRQSSVISAPRTLHIGIVTLAIVIAVVTVSTLRLNQKRAYVKTLRNQAHEEYQKTEETYQHVRTTVDESKGQEGRERMIRENLRAVQDGEEIVILVPEN